MSEPADAERLIREARRDAGRPYDVTIDGKRVCVAQRRELADALEASVAREQAAIKERDESDRVMMDLFEQGLKYGGEACALEVTNAKLTEENRVLRKYMRDAEEMLRKPHDPFVMVNAANLLNQGLAETARDKPAGANDDH